MLALMMKGEVLDAGSAAERFGVQRPIARRNLLEITKHIPAVTEDRSERRHTFRYRSESPAPHQGTHGLTKLSEVIAATLGASFGSVFRGTRYQTDLDKLRKALVARLPRRKDEFEHANRKFFALMGREEVLEDQAGLLDDVIQAILVQKSVDIDYRRFGAKREQLRVNPYTLVIYDSHLYVVGAEVAAGKTKPVHPYRFARIAKLHPTNRRFVYPSPAEYDPKVVFRESIGVWLSDPGPCRIRVKMNEYWANYAKHHRWHDSQRVTPNADGSFELTMHVRPCFELEQWVLRFGENIEVLEPAELREKIGNRLATAAGLYTRKRKRSGSSDPATRSLSRKR
jgi:predicted DNA-binding transcriptional regulator YafY